MAEQCPTMSNTMCFGHRHLDRTRPQVMGVVNVTPDSFSDGGELLDGQGLALAPALKRVQAMIEAGATFIDVGGESTRPGATPVTEQQELDRVVPLVDAIARRFDVVISVDTSSPAVIRESAAAGAGLINDVRALRREGALQAAAETGLPVSLMHMVGEPGTMQDNPHYDNVLQDVTDFLARRMAACMDAGIAREQIILDPGFGFAKNLSHNLQLLARLERLQALGAPLLVGMSRKRMIGTITGRDTRDRLAGSLAVAVIAAMKGAWIIRVHDVPETVDAMKICAAVQAAREETEA